MKYYLLFFIAIASLSQSANITRLADAPALMIGFWRLLGASLCMFCLHAFMSRKNWQNFFQKVSLNTWIWTFTSGFFFFVHLWTFFLAAQTTSIANCMVLYSCNPIFTAIGSWLLLKDKVESRHIVSFLLAFSGIALLAGGHLDFSQGMTGELSAILSALLYSAYILTGKKARLHMQNEQFTWTIYLWGALLFFAMGSLKGIQWLGYPSLTWWAIAGYILFPTLLGHALFTYLLKHLNINWMSCGKLLEPGMSAFVASLAFHEEMQSRTLIAFLLTLMASFVLLQPHLSRKKNDKLLT